MNLKNLIELAIREDALWDRKKDPQGVTLKKRLNALRAADEIYTAELNEVLLMVYTDSKGRSKYYLRELAQRWQQHSLENIPEHEPFEVKEKAFRESFKKSDSLCKRLLTEMCTEEEIKALEALNPTAMWLYYESCTFKSENENNPYTLKEAVDQRSSC